MKDAAALLDLIAEKATKLRAAGVRRVSIAGASFTIGDVDSEDDDDAEDEPIDDLNPMNDPVTFGIRPKKGRSIPARGGKS